METLISLPETRTHKYRVCSVIPVESGRATMYIAQGRRLDTVADIDQYLVEEEQHEMRVGYRSFLVAKQDAVSPDVYRVTIGTRNSCTCQGFQRHRHCKHVDAITGICDRLAAIEEMPREEFPSREQLEADAEYDYGFVLGTA